MQASFKSVKSAEILANPEALKLLTEAAEGFGGLIHVKNLLSHDDETKKKIILTTFSKNAIKLLGVFVLTFTEQEVGRVMTLVLLGGKEFPSWTNEFREFLYKTAHEHDCDQFYYMGRKGFGRIFPELEEVARVYRKILKVKP